MQENCMHIFRKYHKFWILKRLSGIKVYIFVIYVFKKKIILSNQGPLWLQKRYSEKNLGRGDNN